MREEGNGPIGTGKRQLRTLMAVDPLWLVGVSTPCLTYGVTCFCCAGPDPWIAWPMLPGGQCSSFTLTAAGPSVQGQGPGPQAAALFAGQPGLHARVERMIALMVDGFAWATDWRNLRMPVSIAGETFGQPLFVFKSSDDRNAPEAGAYKKEARVLAA